MNNAIVNPMPIQENPSLSFIRNLIFHSNNTCYYSTLALRHNELNRNNYQLSALGMPLKCGT